MILHAASRRHPAVVTAALLTFLALILSACGGTIETDLTLRTGDRFDATSRITMPAQGLMLVGGVEAIESQFRELEQQATAEGFKFSWRRENSKNANEVVYRISTEGKGYEALASTYGILVEKTQYQGQDALSISTSPYYDLSDVQNTIRIHVGKILQTNNQRSGNNIIVWTGTENLQAIVTPAGDTGWVTILVAALAVGVVAALGVLLLRRRPAGQVATAATTSPVAGSGGFCPYCGQPVLPAAKFCMHCGQAVPSRGS